MPEADLGRCFLPSKMAIQLISTGIQTMIAIDFSPFGPKLLTVDSYSPYGPMVSPTGIRMPAKISREVQPSPKVLAKGLIIPTGIGWI